ncbi:hypothetical protein EIM92_18900 [Paenibacillus lentus]|uniref:Uncharacterized protein n=1 Tax=Paenibacillus lentus TaxID=1338368 RepID=A0A3Q8S647_9BACL|nr:hypothetical protein EIM92_18900 [Paenibacillus lentus]
MLSFSYNGISPIHIFEGRHVACQINPFHYSTTANIYVHLDYSSKISSAQVMSATLQIPNMQKAPESPQKETQELVHY